MIINIILFGKFNFLISIINRIYIWIVFFLNILNNNKMDQKYFEIKLCYLKRILTIKINNIFINYLIYIYYIS